MTNTNRRRASIGRRSATAQDLQLALERAAGKGLQSGAKNAPSMPLESPPFLHGLPHRGVVYEPQQTATKELQRIINSCSYTKNFEDAISLVASQGLPELRRIQTLDQFYFYVDALVTWIPEIRVWDWDGELLHERTVYLRLTQFYYYFNQPSLEALQSPIAPITGSELTPISRWLRDFAVAWGSFLDTPASKQYLASFKYAPEYSWQDFEKAPEDYATFNEFFARIFKDIEIQRPVAGAEDDRVIVFPAESTYVGQWAVSTPAPPPLQAPPSIVVKHIEWSIQELLADSEHAEAFEGGLFCHSFLNTFDYHRLHTPVGGKVLEAKFIPGQVYLQVDLEQRDAENDNDSLARAIIPKRVLDAQDATGYQFVQCRGLIVIDSPIGKVACLPMGMAQVSSVVFVTPASAGQKPIVLSNAEKQKLDYQQQVDLLNQKIAKALVGKQVSKGEMFSFFQFGGSDCVVVFERRANVNITAGVNVHYPIRSQYGFANINK